MGITCRAQRQSVTVSTGERFIKRRVTGEDDSAHRLSPVLGAVVLVYAAGVEGVSDGVAARDAPIERPRLGTIVELCRRDRVPVVRPVVPHDSIACRHLQSPWLERRPDHLHHGVWRRSRCGGFRRRFAAPVSAGTTGDEYCRPCRYIAEERASEHQTDFVLDEY